MPECPKVHRIKLDNRTKLLERPKQNIRSTEHDEDEIPLKENDPEVRKDTISLKMQTSKRHGLETGRFSRFSNLHSLQRAIANLIVVIKELNGERARARKRLSRSYQEARSRN